MSEDKSVREMRHTQHYPYSFQSSTYAPVRGGNGKGRFAVEAKIFVPGMGWDTVNPFVQDNEFWVAFYYYVLGKEIMGYEHVGLSAKEIKNWMNNNGYTFEENK
ncbi:hypothetical protein [Nitrosopumilus sp.]|uniref:hypothetical protein n=1 Tax=Nitrosopumilus sp. TaxID=2024843 RepID=UPI003D1246A4